MVLGISPDTWAYIGFLASVGFGSREIWLHRKISALSTNVEWLKNNIEKRQDIVEQKAKEKNNGE